MSPSRNGVGPNRGLFCDGHYPTTKLQLFLAFLLPPEEPAAISTLWAPEESLDGVKLRLPVVRW